MGRTIEMRSGTWTWSAEEDDGGRGGSGPLARTVVLEHTDNAANRMVVQVPPHLGGPGSDAAVAAAAVNPERRFVEDPEGEVWTVWPVSHDPELGQSLARDVVPPREVRATRSGDAATAYVLPGGHGLGQLTHEELLNLLA